MGSGGHQDRAATRHRAAQDRGARSVRHERVPVLNALTAQQLEVAQLAASG
ncbi:hypothetical protein [Streptomyces sp. NBC_00111]|uniref:hypothetical protein n=1 Tax=Streptomyces sp. NBC_00111 TaxID=2975655 RepID=UPI00386567F8